MASSKIPPSPGNSPRAAPLRDDGGRHRTPVYDPLWLMAGMMAIFFALMAIAMAAG